MCALLCRLCWSDTVSFCIDGSCTSSFATTVRTVCTNGGQKSESPHQNDDGEDYEAAKSMTLSFVDRPLTQPNNKCRRFLFLHYYCKIPYSRHLGTVKSHSFGSKCAFRQSYRSRLPPPTVGLLVSRAILTFVNVPELHLLLPNHRTALALPSSSFLLPSLILSFQGKLNQ